jgi:hypothetical protein
MSHITTANNEEAEQNIEQEDEPRLGNIQIEGSKQEMTLHGSHIETEHGSRDIVGFTVTGVRPSVSSESPTADEYYPLSTADIEAYTEWVQDQLLGSEDFVWMQAQSHDTILFHDGVGDVVEVDLDLA